MVMSPEPVRTTPDERVDQMVLRALREGVRTLPVVDAAGRLIGIVTDHDLRRADIPASLHQLKQMTPAERVSLLAPLRAKRVRDVMTQPAASVRDNETLHELIGRILRDQLKRLPVVDAAGHLIGMVTRSDILRELIFADLQTDEDGMLGQLIDWEARVADVNPEPAAVIGEAAPLGDVIARMRASGQKRMLVVREDGRLCGLITPGDLLERAGQAGRPALLAALGGEFPTLPALTASDVMTSAPITVEGTTTAREALRLLLEHQIKRLPVIDAAGRPLGMVGRDGLMRALIALDQELSD
jgi:CBS domain-containing protein